MAEALPWRAERPLDARRVERVVGAQFPDLASAAAVFLDEGWDSEVYLVGGEWILRFPKRREVAEALPVERALLDRLAPLLPLPVPRPTLLGEPCGEFPFPFTGYRRLPGVPAHAVDPGRVDTATCAAQAAEFVHRLHAFPTEEARALGAREERPREPDVLRARYLGLCPDIESAMPPALRERARRFLDGPLPSLGEVALRTVHADLTYDHLLLDPDGHALAGVIDWGDCRVADPAWDYAGLWAWFGEPFVRAVLRARPRPDDPRLAERARLGAVWTSFSSLWWGVRAGRSRDVAAGLRGLDLSLAPAEPPPSCGRGS